MEAVSSGLGGWSNEELANVSLGLLDFVSCFGFGLTDSRRGHVDPGCLFMGLEVETEEQGKIEESFIKVV